MESFCIQAFHTNFNQSVLLEIAQAMVDTVRESACCAVLHASARPTTLWVGGGGGWLCTYASGVLDDCASVGWAV